VGTSQGSTRWSRHRQGAQELGARSHDFGSLVTLPPAPGGFEKIDEVSEFFNVVIHVRLGHFDLAQLRQLAERCEQAWSEEELAAIISLVGGQPYLSRLLLFLNACGVPKASLLNQRALIEQHCASELQQMWLRLRAEPELFAALSQLAASPQTPLAANARHRLGVAGLVESTADNTLRFATPILGDYFRERA
jgi:hypothetical protein